MNQTASLSTSSGSSPTSGATHDFSDLFSSDSSSDTESPELKQESPEQSQQWCQDLSQFALPLPSSAYSAAYYAGVIHLKKDYFLVWVDKSTWVDARGRTEEEALDNAARKLFHKLRLLSKGQPLPMPTGAYAVTRQVARRMLDTWGDYQTPLSCRTVLVSTHHYNPHPYSP